MHLGVRLNPEDHPLNAPKAQGLHVELLTDWPCKSWYMMFLVSYNFLHIFYYPGVLFSYQYTAKQYLKQCYINLGLHYMWIDACRCWIGSCLDRNSASGLCQHPAAVKTGLWSVLCWSAYNAVLHLNERVAKTPGNIPVPAHCTLHF